MVKLPFALGVILSVWIACGVAAHAFSNRRAEAPAPAPAQIWVTRADGARSCSPNSGQSLEDGAAQLRGAHVRVLDSAKGSDGKLHAQMCGAPTGKTNAYLIPKEDLPLAVAQGYVPAQ
jgi:hypothetical protein